MATAARSRTIPREESIYNLVPRPVVRREKPPRYVSTFRPQVKQEVAEKRMPSKTMGPAKVPLNSTSDFLKKNSGPLTTKPAARTRDTKSLSTGPTKPRVPRHDERPVMAPKTEKNFVTKNAVEVIMTAPRKPMPKMVDTPSGSTQELESSKTSSGLLPKHINKKDYGKTPEYLERRLRETQLAQEQYDEYIAESKRRGELQSIQERERQEVIEGLKHNWEDLHRQYQGLSVVTDTLPKKARKERLEAEMKQLEHDIQTLEKHGMIYISDRDPSTGFTFS